MPDLTGEPISDKKVTQTHYWKLCTPQNYHLVGVVMWNFHTPPAAPSFAVSYFRFGKITTYPLVQFPRTPALPELAFSRVIVPPNG